MKISTLPTWFAYTVFAIAVINFAAFVLIALVIGGDALNGHEVSGRYFLSNHGKLTEVGRMTYEYSKWHAISVFITHPVAIFVGWKWSRQQRVLHAHRT